MSARWRDADETMVADERIIELASLVTGEDRDIWYTGDVPEDVWAAVAADLDAERDLLQDLIDDLNAGASWTSALTGSMP